MKSLKFLALASALSLLAAGPASALDLVTTTYSADTDLGTNTEYYLEGATGGTTATWTIDPGVTVTGGRYFIESLTIPNDGLATLIVTGGGTLNINRGAIYNLRFSQGGTTAPGALRIQDGSSVLMTGASASMFQENGAPASSGCFVSLEGVGSTFRFFGTYDATNQWIVGQNGAAGAVPVQVSGGVLFASTPATGFTELTVLSGPPDPELSITPPAQLSNNNTPVSFSIPFTNTGATQNLVVNSISVGGDDHITLAVNSFTSPVAPGGTGMINLTFTPDIGPRIYQMDLTLDTNASVNPLQVIGISVKVTDPGMQLSADRVDFGTLAANPGVTQQTLTVTNTGGTLPLQVDAQLLGTSSQYTLTSAPTSIAPGASADIVVSFNPGAATGHFGNLLRITTDATENGTITLPIVAEVTATAALPTTLGVTNGNFEAIAYNSANTINPNGWTSSLVASPGHYAETIPNYGTNLPALFWAISGAFLQQDLTTANPGLTANQLTSVGITLDRGYRNDTVTSGDILMRVSLWDLTANTEISGRDLVIEDTGVLAAPNSNQLTATQVVLPISTASTSNVALRITTREPQLAANQFQATAIIDNVSLKFAGTYTPPTNPFATWALAKGLDGTPGKENGSADDPDRDGISNFEEFAYGADPLSASSRGLVSVVIQDTNADTQKELLLTAAVRAGASFSGSPSPTATRDGVIYRIQGSTGLAAFDQVVEGPLASPVIPAALPASPPSGYEYRTFRLAGSNGLPSRGFLRASSREVAP